MEEGTLEIGMGELSVLSTFQIFFFFGATDNKNLLGFLNLVIKFCLYRGE